MAPPPSPAATGYTASILAGGARDADLLVPFAVTPQQCGAFGKDSAAEFGSGREDVVEALEVAGPGWW